MRVATVCLSAHYVNVSNSFTLNLHGGKSVNHVVILRTSSTVVKWRRMLTSPNKQQTCLLGLAGIYMHFTGVQFIGVRLFRQLE